MSEVVACAVGVQDEEEEGLPERAGGVRRKLGGCLDPMPKTNFRVAKLCFAEVMYSDWLEKFMYLGTSNQRALFPRSIVVQI